MERYAYLSSSLFTQGSSALVVAKDEGRESAPTADKTLLGRKNSGVSESEVGWSLSACVFFVKLKEVGGKYSRLKKLIRPKNRMQSS